MTLFWVLFIAEIIACLISAGFIVSDLEEIIEKVTH